MAGELAVLLSLRGKAEMVAGLREVRSGINGMTKALRETDVQAGETDSALARTYRVAHVQGFDRMESSVTGLRKSVTGLAGSLLPLIGLAGIGGVAAGLKDAASQATAFQASLTRLQTQAGVSAKNLPGLRSGAMQIASQTGVSATDISNDALFHIEGTFGKTGISDAKALQYARVAAEGAQVGHASLDSTATALAGATFSGIGGASDPTQTMGTLNAIVGAGGTMRMQDLANAIGSGLLPNMKALGLTLPEVGSMLATMTDNAVPADTAIRTLTTSLMHVESPGKAAAAAMASIGLTNPLQLASDLQKANGQMVMLTDLHDHLAKLPVEQQNDVIGQIFGKTKGSGPIQLLLSQMDKVGENSKLINKGANDFTLAWEQAEKTFAIQKARLVQTADNLGMDLGASILPTLSKITGAVASSFGDFANGNTAGGLGDLGVSASDAARIVQGIGDAKVLLTDTGRILHDDVLPPAELIGEVFGATALVGLHTLRDAVGFIADHETTTKVVLDSLLAVLTVKAAGSGIYALGQLPGKLASMPKQLLSWLDPRSSGTAGKTVLGDAGFVQKVYVVNPGFGGTGTGAAEGDAAAGTGLLSGAKAFVTGAGGKAGLLSAGAGTKLGAAATGAGAASTLIGGSILGEQLSGLIYGNSLNKVVGLQGQRLSDYQSAIAYAQQNPRLFSKQDASNISYQARQISLGAPDILGHPDAHQAVIDSQTVETIIDSYISKYGANPATGGGQAKHDTQQPIHVSIQVSGREIANAVATYNSDTSARK